MAIHGHLHAQQSAHRKRLSWQPNTFYCSLQFGFSKNASTIAETIIIIIIISNNSSSSSSIYSSSTIIIIIIYHVMFFGTYLLPHFSTQKLQSNIQVSWDIPDTSLVHMVSAQALNHFPVSKKDSIQFTQ